MKMIYKKEVQKRSSVKLLELTELMIISVIPVSAKFEYDFADNEDKARDRETEIRRIYKKSLVSLL